MLNKEIKESPFYPGKPIPVDYFIARNAEIQEIIRIIRQSSHNRNESIFIQGERGIGKSSLADYVLYQSEKHLNFVGCHCYLGNAKNLESMAGNVFQRLISKITDEDSFKKIKSIFEKYIKSVSLSGVGFGIGIEFTKDEKELSYLVDSFVPAICQIYNSIKDKKSGIILILDDLNGITNLPEFSPFVKSFVDELSPKNIPLTLMFIGVSQRWSDLIKHQPSTGRIFRLIDLKPFDEQESKKFLIDNFNRVDVQVRPSVIEEMVKICGGFPMFLHEVGDAVFLRDKDGLIDLPDYVIGIYDAAMSIGRRYLNEQVINEIRSETYINILGKLSLHPLGIEFTRKELLEQFSEIEAVKEKRNIDNFIRRMKKLGVIKYEYLKYTFVNDLYHLYFKLLLEAFAKKKKA